MIGSDAYEGNKMEYMFVSGLASSIKGVAVFFDKNFAALPGEDEENDKNNNNDR